MKPFLSLIIFIACIVSIQAQQLKTDLQPVDTKSEVKFTIKNFGLNTNGSLSGLNGTINFNPSNLSAASFKVTLDVNTINTGIGMRDDHLKGEDFFNVAKYPNISFVSTSIKAENNGYIATGQLTIKGITKNISFPFTAVSQNGGTLFTGSFSINRKDFGVGGSSTVMSNNVDVDLKVFAQ